MRIQPIITQTKAQLVGVYGKEVADNIIGNSFAQIYFSVSELDLAEKLSKICGTYEVKETEKVVVDLFDNKPLRVTKKAITLMPVQEIMSLKENVLILIQGFYNRPFLIPKLKFYGTKIEKLKGVANDIITLENQITKEIKTGGKKLTSEEVASIKEESLDGANTQKSIESLLKDESKEDQDNFGDSWGESDAADTSSDDILFQNYPYPAMDEGTDPENIKLPKILKKTIKKEEDKNAEDENAEDDICNEIAIKDEGR